MGMVNGEFDMDIVRCLGYPERLFPKLSQPKTVLGDLLPEIAEKVEAEVRENLWKLNGGTPKAPAKAAEKAVAVSADDFDDED